MRKILFYSLVLAVSMLGSARAQMYTIDPVHSDISIKVRHMVVSKVSGRFNQFSGTFSYDESSPKNWETEAEIQAGSINTFNQDRDKHLCGADFLDVEHFPTLSFKSSKVSAVKDGKAQLTGTLTLHGITKEVTLNLEIGGTIKDPMGNLRAGFEATTQISRKDFGLTYNKILETGGVAVGDTVEISIRIEGIAKKT